MIAMKSNRRVALASVMAATLAAGPALAQAQGDPAAPRPPRAAPPAAQQVVPRAAPPTAPPVVPRVAPQAVPRVAPPAAPPVVPRVAPQIAPRVAPQVAPPAAPPAAPPVARPPAADAPARLAPQAAPKPAPAPSTGAAPKPAAPAPKPAAAPSTLSAPVAPQPAATAPKPATQPSTLIAPKAAPQTAPQIAPVAAPPAAPSAAPLASGAQAPAAPAAAPVAPGAGVAPLAAPPRVPDGAPRPVAPPPVGQKSGRISPAGAAALGAAAGLAGGLVGGFMLGRDGAAARGLDDVRGQRREINQDGANIVYEPGRTIVREDDRYFLRHDENERFRQLGGDFRSERRGDDFVSVYRRPNGDQIVTYTDTHGNLIRRVRRTPDGAEIVIIDNRFGGGPRAFAEDVVVLPPPPMRLAPERYAVDAGMADERLIYDTLSAPPVAPLPRRFTLDEVRYSPSVRAYTRSVDVNTINFASGSWTVEPQEIQRLGTLARALNEAIARNASEVFLIEGHTDAVGSDVDNLSLSDRRAQAVAAVLTRDFNVPPENLTTQGYGEQFLKTQTQEARRENRRVTVRRITSLLSGQNG